MSDAAAAAAVSADGSEGVGEDPNANTGLTTERLTVILRKLLREPVAQSVIATTLSEVGERMAGRLVRRAFGQP